MCGSFNNYAHKVRNRHLPIGRRVSGLHSCIYQVCGTADNCSYLSLREQISRRVEFDLYPITDEEQLLAAFQYLQSIREQVLAIRRAFDDERKRQKSKGRRVPPKAEHQAFKNAIAAALTAGPKL